MPRFTHDAIFQEMRSDPASMPRDCSSPHHRLLIGAASPSGGIFPSFRGSCGAPCSGAGGGIGAPASLREEHEEEVAQEENENGSIAAMSATKARNGRSAQLQRDAVTIVPSGRISYVMHACWPGSWTNCTRSPGDISERLWTWSWQCSQKRRFASPDISSQFFGQGFATRRGGGSAFMGAIYPLCALQSRHFVPRLRKR